MATRIILHRITTSLPTIGRAALAAVILAPALWPVAASAQTLSALTPPNEAPPASRPLAWPALRLEGLPASVLRQGFARTAPPQAAVPRQSLASRPATAARLSAAVKPAGGVVAKATFQRLDRFSAPPVRGIQFGTLSFEDDSAHYDPNAYRRQGPVW